MNSKSHHDAYLKGLESLLDFLCSEWGFCNRLNASDLLLPGKTLTADEFSQAVLKAELMDPNHSHWFYEIRKEFIKHFKTASIPEKSIFDFS